MPEAPCQQQCEALTSDFTALGSDAIQYTWRSGLHHLHRVANLKAHKKTGLCAQQTQCDANCDTAVDTNGDTAVDTNGDTDGDTDDDTDGDTGRGVESERQVDILGRSGVESPDQREMDSLPASRGGGRDSTHLPGAVAVPGSHVPCVYTLAD